MWAAKAVNAILLPYLKRFSITRSALRGYDQYQLHTDDPEAIIYSADLTKSTDPMSVALVRHIFQAVQDAIPDLPNWFAPAIESILGELELEHDGVIRTTKCGALMGMGPGWTALCLLNAFCAHYAGAHRDSFKVCGDDLVGLWPREVCDRYEQNLIAFGLVPNKSKSFRSRQAGTFCERLVGRTGRLTATVFSLVRLGEASGFRACGGEKGRLSHDRLMKSKVIRPIRWLVRNTTKRYTLGPKVRGLYTQGGGGQLPPDVLTVVGFFMNGGTKLTMVEEHSKALEDVRKLPPSKTGVPIKRVIARIRKHEHDARRRRLRQCIKKPDLKPRSKVRKSYDIRRSKAAKLLREGATLRKTLAHLRENGDSIVPKDHPRDSVFENRVIRLCQHKRYGSAINAIKDWKESTLIDEDTATKFLYEHFPQVSFPVTLHLLPAPGVWDSNRPPR
jgi:hypothetical protein